MHWCTKLLIWTVVMLVVTITCTVTVTYEETEYILQHSSTTTYGPYDGDRSNDQPENVTIAEAPDVRNSSSARTILHLVENPLFWLNTVFVDCDCSAARHGVCTAEGDIRVA